MQCYCYLRAFSWGKGVKFLNAISVPARKLGPEEGHALKEAFPAHQWKAWNMKERTMTVEYSPLGYFASLGISIPRNPYDAQVDGDFTIIILLDVFTVYQDPRIAVFPAISSRDQACSPSSLLEKLNAGVSSVQKRQLQALPLRMAL
jgi:hypothetical protein